MSMLIFLGGAYALFTGILVLGLCKAAGKSSRDIETIERS